MERRMRLGLLGLGTAVAVLFVLGLVVFGGVLDTTGSEDEVARPTAEEEAPGDLRTLDAPTLVGKGGASARKGAAEAEASPWDAFQTEREELEKLESPTHELVVRARSRSGVAVVAVRLFLHEPRRIALSPRTIEAVTHQATTDRAGVARILVPSNLGLRLEARPPAPWLPSDELLVEAGTKEVELVLVEGATVEGLVLSRRGRRAPGVVVTLAWSRGTLRGLVRCTSDARGAFAGVVPRDAAEVVAEIREAPEGEGGAEGPGSPGPRARVEGLRPGARDVVLELGEAAELSGWCVGPDGEVLHPSSIQVIPRVGPASWSAPFPIDPETGRFHVTGLRHVPYWVLVKGVPAGYVAPPPEPIPLPAQDVRLVCPGGPTAPLPVVEGTVEGMDLAGFRATWLPERTAWQPLPSSRVDADGAFRIGGVPPGRGAILVQADGDTRCAWLADVDPASGPFDLRLAPGRTIHGRITGWPAETIDQLEIVLSMPTGRDRRARVRNGGRFRFAGLPAGRYGLRTSDRYVPRERLPLVRRSIELEDLEPSEREMVLDLGVR